MVVGATKLTADSWSSVVDDVYNRPTKKRPYYYVHNQNDIHVDEAGDEGAKAIAGRNSELPTNLDTDALHDVSIEYDAEGGLATVTANSGFARTFDYFGAEDTEASEDTQKDAIEKPAGSRHANSSRVKVEIRCGRDKSNIFSLSAVQIDYVKAPQFIRLTQEQLDSDEDISQVMEFPDYVNQEIVNELVNLVMRKTNDPSLSAHM
jgi:YD repeat-containing protein